MVDLACGAALGPAYSQKIFDEIVSDKSASDLSPVERKRKVVVFIVCGGSKVGLNDMYAYRNHLEEVAGEPLRAWVDEICITLD